MSDIAIRVEGLSKAYRIGLKEQQHETMLGALAAWVKSPFRNYREVRNLSRFDDANTLNPQPSTLNSDIVWALKDVSFEVKHGEAVGIIGRNGAGKSTLLKILSRITEPTRGRATVYGRVASLLEVGTGFHPDLTGRENVYLNGTILGMKKREIDAKFDEIVDFSGVEKFIDTPVKRYSSGMRVRLAFAVAAHLEPEILIVDEVLAVGDAEFQKKCLGKMQNVAGQGRTVLFVSHNMAAIRNLCSAVALLADGRLAMEGQPASVVSHYLRLDASHSQVRWTGADMPGDDLVRLRMVQVTGSEGPPTETVDMEEPFAVEMEYEIQRKVDNLQIGFRLSTADGTAVLTSSDMDGSCCNGRVRLPGLYHARCLLPGGLLSPQSYHLSFGAHVPGVQVHFFLETALELTVARTHPRGATVDDKRQGVICPVLPWNVRRAR